MRDKITFWATVLCVMLLSSCSVDKEGPMVTPPSWKGFNYVVKRAKPDGQPGEYVQVERGELRPGDDIKVYAVRKNDGHLVGQISGDMYLRCVIYQENGAAPESFVLDKSVISLANSAYDGWEDPYATFQLPTTDQPYYHFRVDVACQFYFKAFGTQNSPVDNSDMTSHEEPYLGDIYTDYAGFDPLNGGSANSGNDGDGLKYHTIYKYTKY